MSIYLRAVYQLLWEQEQAWRWDVTEHTKALPGGSGLVARGGPLAACSLSIFLSTQKSFWLVSLVTLALSPQMPVR